MAGDQDLIGATGIGPIGPELPPSESWTWSFRGSDYSVTHTTPVDGTNINTLLKPFEGE